MFFELKVMDSENTRSFDYIIGVQLIRINKTSYERTKVNAH